MARNPNDEIRQQILQYFYDRNENASSRFGKRGSAVKIGDVRRELKQRHGLVQRQVVANLNYLIDRGWVKAVEQEKTYTVPDRGVTVPSTVTWYEITAVGIDKIEGGSEFERADRSAGINITATGSNVITLGDGNIVNAAFADLHDVLDTLKTAITESAQLPDGDKLDIAVDIESIKDQLAKQQPNRTVVRQLWSGVEKAATAAGFIEAVSLVQQALSVAFP